MVKTPRELFISVCPGHLYMVVTLWGPLKTSPEIYYWKEKGGVETRGGDEFMVRRGCSGGGKIATSNLLRAQRLV